MTKTNFPSLAQFIHRPLLALLVLLLTPPFLLAQPSPFAAIAPKMQTFVDQGQIAGIAPLVADKDPIPHLAAVGYSDLSTGRKMQTDDLFWIASMSKPITAVGLGVLVDDGKITWDDPVEKFIPEFKDVTLRPALDGVARRPSRPITIRDLVTHTSAMGDMTRRDPHLTLADTAVALAKLPLRFDPGSKWAYSTAALDVCGRIIEVAAKMPFA